MKSFIYSSCYISFVIWFLIVLHTYFFIFNIKKNIILEETILHNYSFFNKYIHNTSYTYHNGYNDIKIIKYQQPILQINNFIFTEDGVGIPQHYYENHVSIKKITSLIDLNLLDYNDFKELYTIVSSCNKIFNTCSFFITSLDNIICIIDDTFIIKMSLGQSFNTEIVHNIYDIKKYYDTKETHLKKKYHYITLDFENKNKLYHTLINEKEYHEILLSF